MNNGDRLDDQAKNEALSIARKTLSAYLTSGKIPSLIPKSKILFTQMGAFVTLRKKGDLRGCIGLIEADKPLYKVIQEMVVSSGTKDPRFLPIAINELKDVIIEISILTPPKKIIFPSTCFFN